MAFATFPVSQVVAAGPKNRSFQYMIQIPAGQSITDGAYAAIDNIPGGWFGVHVSGTPSSAPSDGVGVRLTVYGTFDGPSIVPSGRNWWVARGDVPPFSASGGPTDAGLNKYLLAVTIGGMITLREPARAYRFRVSTGVSNSAPTSAINISAMLVVPERF